MLFHVQIRSDDDDDHSKSICLDVKVYRMRMQGMYEKMFRSRSAVVRDPDLQLKIFRHLV